MIRETCKSESVEFKLFWKGSNKIQDSAILPIYVSMESVPDKIMAFVPDTIRAQTYVPLSFKIQEQSNDFKVASISYPPSIAQTMEFKGRKFLNYKKFNSIDHKQIICLPTSYEDFHISIKNKPKFNAGEHYGIYIKNKNGSLKVKFKLEAEDYSLKKETSFSELMERTWQYYRHCKSANLKNDCQQAINYALEKQVPHWIQTFSSEDFTRLTQEAKEYQKNNEKLVQIALTSIITNTLERLGINKSHDKHILPILCAIEKNQIQEAFKLASAFKTERRNFAFMVMTEIFIEKNMMDEAKKAMVQVDEKIAKNVLIQKYCIKKELGVICFQNLFNQIYSDFEKLKSSYKTQNKKRYVTEDQQKKMISIIIEERASGWLKLLSSNDFERLLREGQKFDPSSTMQDGHIHYAKSFVQKLLIEQLNTYKLKQLHLENIKSVKIELSFGLIDNAFKEAGKIVDPNRRYFAFSFIAHECLNKNLIEKAQEALDNIPDVTPEKAEYLRAYAEKIASLEKKPKE